MNKKDKYPPEYLFWKKRIEGQIRHTMYEHPEFFTKEAHTDNLVGRMAKRIIGEIVAGTFTGNNSSSGAIPGATVLEGKGATARADSGVASGIITAGHSSQGQR